ncbi:hypothetical protein C6341_g9282 [Phytophthora cactorum]|nr:hypothetical protein C6341_g9282 [Phytophthora cactorum]
MRTSFADAEDKLLVQIAFQFEREGLRITWDYVVRRMKTKRPARQFRLRLASLKRTYGKSISGFPPCFLGGLYSRRLLSAPGLPPPPRVSQRPARPNRVHSSPPAHVQGLSVRQGGQCDRGDHPAVATAASGAVVGDGDADDNTITSVGSAISQSVAAELQGQQSHCGQGARFGVFGEVAAGLAVDDGAGSAREPGLCEGRGGRAGPLVARATSTSGTPRVLELQTALGRASAAPPGKKVMSIVGHEVVVRAEDLRLGGWQVPTVYQVRVTSLG